MAPTFGVTYTQFAYRFAGNTFSDWSTQIGRWVDMAASELAILLRQLGREADDVDSASDLYSICAKYIESAVMSDIAQAMTRQDPQLAIAARAERDRVAKMIRDYNESLSDDDFDRAEMLGAARAGGSGRRSGAGFWKQGRRW